MSYKIQVWRGSFLLYVAQYQASFIEEARNYARGFYAWNGISAVQMSYRVANNGEVTETVESPARSYAYAA